MGVEKPDIEAEIEVTVVEAEDGVSKWGVVEDVTGWEHIPGQGYCRYDKERRIVCMVKYEGGGWAFYYRLSGNMNNELFRYGVKSKKEGESVRLCMLRAMRRCDLAMVLMNIPAATDEYEKKTSE